MEGTSYVPYVGTRLGYPAVLKFRLICLLLSALGSRLHHQPSRYNYDTSTRSSSLVHISSWLITFSRMIFRLSQVPSRSVLKYLRKTSQAVRRSMTLPSHGLVGCCYGESLFKAAIVIPIIPSCTRANKTHRCHDFRRRQRNLPCNFLTLEEQRLALI